MNRIYFFVHELQRKSKSNLLGLKYGRHMLQTEPPPLWYVGVCYSTIRSSTLRVKVLLFLCIVEFHEYQLLRDAHTVFLGASTVCVNSLKRTVD